MRTPLRSVHERTTPLARAVVTLAATVSLLACSGHASKTADNGIEVTSSCALPRPCGGDLTGSWDIVHGCAQVDGATCLGGGDGTVSGTFTASGSGYSLDMKTSIRACDMNDSSSSGSSGTYQITGSTLTLDGATTYEFCAVGNSLTLIRPRVKSPDLAVLELVRSTRDAGADDGGFDAQ